MNPKLLSIATVLTVGCIEPTTDNMTEPTIEYRGQQFRMKRDFADYEEYSDTADPIASQDQEKVANAVRRATMPIIVPSIAAMARAIGDVKFPGFQSGTLVVKDKAQFGHYYGGHVMIPYSNFSRYFIFAQRDSHLELIHDVELKTSPKIFHFAVSDEAFTYYRSNGKTHKFMRNEEKTAGQGNPVE